MQAPANAENRGKEADFRLNELFFSRTDPGGIIKAGNSIFQRVSEYEAQDLWDKPHKLIRHPDTPRGVFYKLWSTIKAGQPIGAYVKNSSRSGKYYWVYAVVAPVDGGYLSIRLKPTSSLFDKVRDLYIVQAGRERTEGLDPAQSADEIDQALGKLGFESYEAFMSQALKQELDARDRGLGRSTSTLSSNFDRLHKSANVLLDDIKAISASLDSVKNTPFNLRIFASQMGDEGEGLAVIAANYVTLLEELRALLSEFDNTATDIANSLDEALLLNFIVQLQREMIDFFQSEEGATDGVDKEAETDQLERLSGTFNERAQLALNTVRARCMNLPGACQAMKRQATALDVIRLMAKVEMSNNDQNSGIILELEQRLEACQETLQSALNNIARESMQTLNAIRDMARLNEIATRDAGTSQALAKAS